MLDPTLQLNFRQRNGSHPCFRKRTLATEGKMGSNEVTPETEARRRLYYYTNRGNEDLNLRSSRGNNDKVTDLKNAGREDVGQT